MNDFDKFDKYFLIGALLVVLGIAVGFLAWVGYSFGELMQGQMK